MTIPDAVLYDCEIATCVPPTDGSSRDPTLRYCAGWDDYPNMGISVVAAYDTRARRMRVFCFDNLPEFRALIADRLVIGFNNRGFDDRLLMANGIQVSRSWDLLCALRRAVGEPEEYMKGITQAGRSLEQLAQANLRRGKVGHGAVAPVWWQNGQVGAVIDYCLDDVMLLLELVRKAAKGLLVDPVTNRITLLEMP